MEPQFLWWKFYGMHDPPLILRSEKTVVSWWWICVGTCKVLHYNKTQKIVHTYK